jgi:hypothetical protein
MLVEAAENCARKSGHAEMASDCVIENHVSLQAHQRLADISQLFPSTS